jgi:transposase-like protein
MRRKRIETSSPSRRAFTDEFKQESVQMLLDGHSAQSVAERLGLSGTNLLYRWRRQQLERSGPVANDAYQVETAEASLDCQVCSYCSMSDS